MRKSCVNRNATIKILFNGISKTYDEFDSFLSPNKHGEYSFLYANEMLIKCENSISVCEENVKARKHFAFRARSFNTTLLLLRICVVKRATKRESGEGMRERARVGKTEKGGMGNLRQSDECSSLIDGFLHFLCWKRRVILSPTLYEKFNVK